MFSEKDRVFVITKGNEFQGESGMVVNVIPAGNRTDPGQDLFDHVLVKFMDETVKWFDETALKQDRRLGGINFESYPVKRKSTLINRLMHK